MQFTPEILPALFSNVEITIGYVPTKIGAAVSSGVFWQASADELLLNVPNVASYLISKGHRVIIKPAVNSSYSDICRVLCMTPLAALSYQRGFLAFHSAAAYDGRNVIVISGDSGSGKSALLMALLCRGWKMFADDLLVVDPSGSDLVKVYPNISSIALWPDTLKKQNHSTNGLKHFDANRLEFTPINRVDVEMKPISSIYWLSVHSEKRVLVEKAPSSLYFQAAGALLYNSHIADALYDKMLYLKQMARIADTIPLFKLKRPRGQWSVDELADIVSD